MPVENLAEIYIHTSSVLLGKNTLNLLSIQSTGCVERLVVFSF